MVRPLRYSINVTLDGCCDHRAGTVDEETHRHATRTLDRADALLFGRVTYEMMETAFRPPGQLEAMPDWMTPFARTIDSARKYVVSSTLDRVDWNAELIRGDLGEAVRALKREPGKGLYVGGVKLPLALAELGLIDEYEFVVHPRIAGHGPTLFAGLSNYVDLKLVDRLEFGSGAVALRYEPKALGSPRLPVTDSRAGSRGVLGRTVLIAVAFSLLIPAAGQAKRNVYVTHFASNNVAAFDVAGSCALMPLPGSPFRRVPPSSVKR